MSSDNVTKNQESGIQLIQSPEEVSSLLKDLWINHKNGITPSGEKVFIVKLPPLENQKEK